MKSVLAISPVENGYVMYSESKSGDKTKYAFTPTIIEAVQAAIRFQMGTESPTPEFDLAKPRVELMRLPTSWAVCIAGGIGVDIADVLPLGVGEYALADAVARAMSAHAEKVTTAAAKVTPQLAEVVEVVN